MLKKDLCNAIINAVRDTVLENHIPASCIASTLVLREVLKRGFNIDLLVRALTTTVYNPYVTRKIRAGETDPAQYVKSPEGWSVGIGYGGQAVTDPTKWAGHMCGISKHDDGTTLLLWDPSLDQASRPGKNINMRPLVFPIPADPYYGQDAHLEVNQCLVVYEDNEIAMTDLTNAPDWVRPKHFDRNVKHALRKLSHLIEKDVHDPQ